MQNQNQNEYILSFILSSTCGETLFTLNLISYLHIA